MFTDLLVGIILGLATSLVIILLESFNNSHFLHLKKEEGLSSIVLAEEVIFFNKAAILKSLQEIPNGNKLEIDLEQLFSSIMTFLKFFMNFKKRRQKELFQ